MYPKVSISFTQGDASTREQRSQGTSQTNVSNVKKAFQDSVASLECFQLAANRNAVQFDLSGSGKLFPEEGFPGFMAPGSATSATLYFRVRFDRQLPEYLYIVFDPASREYASNITLASAAGTISVTGNTDTIVAIPLNFPSVLDNNAPMLLTVSGWSAPGHSIKICSIIFNAPGITLYGSDIISFNCSENLMDSELSLSPGICEQYANLTLYDRNSLIRNLAIIDQLHQDARILLMVVDGEDEVEIGSYVTAEWSINAEDSRVAVTCRDLSYKFDKIDVGTADIKNRSVDDMLTFVFNRAGGLTWQYLDAETRQRCQDIQVPNSWWPSSSLLEVLQSVCSLGLLRIYWYINSFIVGRC